MSQEASLPGGREPIYCGVFDLLSPEWPIQVFKITFLCGYDCDGQINIHKNITVTLV